MKKLLVWLLCLPVLLAGCGAAPRSEALQRHYGAVEEAAMETEIICHLPQESRSFTVACTYRAEGESEVTVTAPEELAGIHAVVSGDELELRYDDLALSAGRLDTLCPANCAVWLLRAAREGYVLEEGRETLGEIPCLRLTFDTTAPDGEKVVCTVWFDEESLAPRYGEFTVDGALVLSVDVLSFTAVLSQEETP